jgi:probable rRNA maturation factor
LTQITVSNRQRSLKVNTAWLARFAGEALARCLKHPRRNKQTVLAGLESVDVVIVSDRVIAEIHRQFMNVDGPTDVITFDHGEIIISAPMAQRYAREFGGSASLEIGLYIVHGLLHLNGYDDRTGPEARVMRRLQDKILAACLVKLGRRL